MNELKNHSQNLIKLNHVILSMNMTELFFEVCMGGRGSQAVCF